MSQEGWGGQPPQEQNPQPGQPQQPQPQQPPPQQPGQPQQPPPQYAPPPGQYGPPPPGQYGPPGYPQYQAGPPAPPNNGLAIASLCLGIAGAIFVLPLIGSIGALVCGYMGKSQIDESNGAQGGRGMAVTGIVLGYIGLALAILFGLLFAFVFSQADDFIREIKPFLTPSPDLTF